MREIKLNRNSWHYYLATKMGGYIAPYTHHGEDEIYGDSADICTYSKHVMNGLFLLTMLGAIFAFFGYIVSNVILGVWFSIMLGVFFFTDMGIIGLIVIGAWASIFMVRFAASRRYDRNLSTEHKNRPDNFIKNAYKGWKEKYCSKITFVGADNKLKVKFIDIDVIGNGEK